MAGNSTESGRSVTSKVIAILLSLDHGRDHTLTDLARAARLPVSTAYRLVTELTAWGALERTEDGRYRIGERLATLGNRSAADPPRPTINERTWRIMEDLAVAYGRGDVRLGVLAGHRVAFLGKPPGDRPVPAAFEPGTLPAHATAMGKVLLAFSPPSVAEMVIARGLTRYTEFTVTADGLRRSLSIIRATGVAVARRELDPDTIAVAAPVFGPGGKVVAALELLDHDIQHVRLMSGPLIVAARCLSRELLTPFDSAQLPLWPAVLVSNNHHTSVLR